MAQSIPPLRLDSLGGVFTAGNVFRRPSDSAVRCFNLQPKPGGALRLRGGWFRRGSVGGDRVAQLHEFRKGTFGGGVYHVAQLHAPGVQDAWASLGLPGYGISTLEIVAGGAGVASESHRAITTVRDMVFWDNGLGVRDATNSRPALTSWDGTRLRYVGLDAWCPGGLPPNAFVGSLPPANDNTFVFGVTIWVGLYNSATNHYSNGVKAGTLGPMSNATIFVDNLNRLTYAAHDAAEEAELFYVFWATGDGLEVPFLILNSAGDDVYRIPVAGASGSYPLSLTDQVPEGFYVSPAHEMPTENFPPRPVRDMCYQNGRVYYVLRAGGTGAAPSEFKKFTYVNPDKDATAVFWTASTDEFVETEFVGKPEESFPLTHRKYVPSGEIPVKIADLANRGQVLVLTATQSFWLEETMDGLHVFQRISENRGILDRRTYCRTPRGPMWVTQHYEIVLLHEDSMSLEVLSGNYSSMLTEHNYPGSSFGAAADFLLDPLNQIDRYQVFARDGYFICHDFRLEQDQEQRGVTVAPAWSGKAYAVSAAKTMRDADGKTHHITAETAIWTQEGQPDTRRIVTQDNPPTGTDFLEVEGQWVSQWLDFGDPLLRKEITSLFLIGDAAHSQQLNDRPVTLYWYSDLYNPFPELTDNIASLVKHDQSPTDMSFLGMVNNPHMRWFKLRVKLRGHSHDDSYVSYPMLGGSDAEINPAAYIYGHLAQLAITSNSEGGNR